MTQEKCWFSVLFPEIQTDSAQMETTGVVSVYQNGTPLTVNFGRRCRDSKLISARPGILALFRGFPKEERKWDDFTVQNRYRSLCE